MEESQDDVGGMVVAPVFKKGEKTGSFGGGGGLKGKGKVSNLVLKPHF